MRALGPGSVSSFLKIALDVVYIAIWAAMIGVAVAGVVLLLLQPFSAGKLHLNVSVHGQAQSLDVLRNGPMMLTALIGVELYLTALIVVFNRLRRVFETLTAGDPFRPENVGRLRVIGLALIGLEALGYLVQLTAAWLFPKGAADVNVSVNLTAWFAILVVFVLAEVFREGARLRRDAELTI